MVVMDWKLTEVAEVAELTRYSRERFPSLLYTILGGQTGYGNRRD